MNELNGKQKRTLKSLAHHLKPVVYVGKHGMTDALAAAVDQALADHELIKIKFNDFKDEKRVLIAELAARTGAETVSMIGNVATIYRRNPDETKRKIEL